MNKTTTTKTNNEDIFTTKLGIEISNDGVTYHDIDIRNSIDKLTYIDNLDGLNYREYIDNLDNISKLKKDK